MTTTKEKYRVYYYEWQGRMWHPGIMFDSLLQAKEVCEKHSKEFYSLFKFEKVVITEETTPLGPDIHDILIDSLYEDYGLVLTRWYELGGHYAVNTFYRSSGPSGYKQLKLGFLHQDDTGSSPRFRIYGEYPWNEPPGETEVKSHAEAMELSKSYNRELDPRHKPFTLLR